MSMTQGEAVFQAVQSILKGEISGKVTLTSEQKHAVEAEVLSFFQLGECAHSNKTIDEAGLKKYIPGLVNNWLRKDKRLNGGDKYVTQKPGSRAGSGDESLKAMKALLSVTKDEDSRAQIQLAIEERQAALKPKPAINVAALPEALRHLVAS